MRVMKCALAFILVFCTMAVTVVCAAVVADEGATFEKEMVSVTEETVSTEAENNNDAFLSDKPELSVVGASEYKPRLTAPSKNNKYYYSDINVFYKHGWGMPNCTAYAYGRAYEILGKEPELCIYSAYLWYDYNKDNKCYAYGKTPKLGAIACYTYKDGTGGHVAVVEKITKDTVYYSNSAYSGENFYVNTAPLDDPTDGRSNWLFQGYIYIGDYEVADENPQQGDVYKITSDNGVNMRKGAGTSYAIVSAIPMGQTVTVTKTKKADGYLWGYTTYLDKSGWFVTDFAELIYSNDGSNSTINPDEQMGMLGDVDLDSKLSIMDATLIQLFISQLETPTQKQLALCDYDKDSTISVMDSTALRFTLAQL